MMKYQHNVGMLTKWLEINCSGGWEQVYGMTPNKKEGHGGLGKEKEIVMKEKSYVCWL